MKRTMYRVNKSVVSYDSNRLCELIYKRNIKTGKELKNHSLIGKYLYNKKVNKVYTITGVFEDYFVGRFIKLLYITSEGSHGVLFWKALTEVPPVIMESIERANENYTIF